MSVIENNNLGTGVYPRSKFAVGDRFYYTSTGYEGVVRAVNHDAGTVNISYGDDNRIFTLAESVLTRLPKDSQNTPGPAPYVDSSTTPVPAPTASERSRVEAAIIKSADVLVDDISKMFEELHAGTNATLTQTQIDVLIGSARIAGLLDAI